MSQRRADLDQFFHPRGVALLGSVPRDAESEQLRSQHQARWGERFYLVNPRGGAVGDIPIYERVTDVPDAVGLAVINVGPQFVPGALEECGECGIPYALIFTAGFSEVGPQGAALEQQVAEIGRRYGMRLFGPNTNTNAFERMPEIPNLRGGKIGLLTQSGHNGRPIVQGALFGIGFSRWVPTGNEVDLEVSDFLEYFADDEDTAVIAGYFEGFKNAAKLRRALEAANARRKPVVALKMGRTEAGRRMASSHTGHLTGSDAVADGLFRQYGVVRVDDLDELLETAALFAKLPAGTGPRACLYSISGGSGTLMAEVAESAGVPVPCLSDDTQRALHAIIPGYLTVANPVDNGGQFVASAPAEQRRRVLELIAADPAVDIIVVGLTGALASMTDNFSADINDFIDESPKPIVVTWNSFKTDEEGFDALVANGVPMFRSFRNCFKALEAFNEYQRGVPAFRTRPPLDAALPAEVTAILDGGGVLDAAAARALLGALGVPMASEAVVTSAGEAASVASPFGYPVVMKIASRDFPHKSDAGLVRLGVASDTEARAAFEELIARAAEADPDAQVDGVLVQEQVGPGVEMIVGVTRDPTFGAAVLVGTGGIFAEILEDVAVRPLPLDRLDAHEMVASLRGAALLAGARGRPAADVGALVDIILGVARLAAGAGARLRELDLNPVLVRPDGAKVVDSLIVAG